MIPITSRYVTAETQFLLQTSYLLQHDGHTAVNSGVRLPMENKT